jgi:hypothetical protein
VLDVRVDPMSGDPELRRIVQGDPTLREAFDPAELEAHARSAAWDGCRGVADVGGDGGLHVCVLDVDHAGKCLCGSCAEHFVPTRHLAADPDSTTSEGDQ